jgi:ABC-type glycerol-3-phosphate transport system substrate-binding protein
MEVKESMSKTFVRFLAMITALLMVSSILSACEKGNVTVAATSGPEQQKTTVKATSAATKTNTASTQAVATVKESSATPVDANAEFTEITSETAEINGVTSSESEAGKYEGLEQVNITLEGSYTAGDIDLGGQIFVYAAYGDTQMPGDSQDKSPAQVLHYLRIKKAEEKYNFKAEPKVVPGAGNYKSQIIEETLAGIKFADVFFDTTARTLPTYITQGIILPIDDYFDFSEPIIKVNSIMTGGAIWGGRHYGISASVGLSYPRVIFNNALLSREGLPNILDLVKSDQWNWSTSLDIAIKATRDTDGNGITDQWGICTYPDFYADFVLQILYSNGITVVDFDNNGKKIYALNKPEAYRALQFAWDLHNVYKVHIIEPKGNQYLLHNYGQGKVAMYLNTVTYNRDALATGMESYVAPLPKGLDVNVYQNIAACSAWWIPVTVKNPREVARIWFETCINWDENGNDSVEYQEIAASQGVRVDYNWSATNPSRRYSTEREYELSIKPMLMNFKTDNLLGYPESLKTTLIYNQIFKGIENGDASVTSLVAKIESAAQDIIDEY